MGFILKGLGILVLIFFFLIITFYIKFLRPLSTRRITKNDIITTRNTSLNSKLNLNPMVQLRRRGLRYRNFSDEEDDVEEVPITYTFKSKPSPGTIKGVLKARHLLPPTIGGVGEDTTSEGSIDSDSVATDEEATIIVRKQVRLVEPSAKVSLEALRELWSKNEGEEGSDGGIGGYRRTRDFISKSKTLPKITIATVLSSAQDTITAPSKASVPLHQTLSSNLSRTSSPSSRLHYPTSRHNNSPSPSRINTLRPRNGSPSTSTPSLPFPNSPTSNQTNSSERSSSPSTNSNFVARTSSPLGIRRRRAGSTTASFPSSSNSTILVSEPRTTPRWISSKTVIIGACESPVPPSRTRSTSTSKGRREKDHTEAFLEGEKEEDSEDSDYEDVNSGGSGSSTPELNNSGGKIMAMTCISSNSNHYHHMRSPAGSVDLNDISLDLPSSNHTSTITILERESLDVSELNSSHQHHQILSPVLSN